MAAIFASESRVHAAIEQHEPSLSIAAVNGPENTVVSGSRAAVERIVGAFAAQGVQAERLSVSHAFHSELMEPMLDEFERVAARVQYSQPRIALVSNVTGRVAAGDEVANAAYWRRHARGIVRFSGGMKTLRETGCRLFIEIGPAPVLLGMGQRCGDAESAAWLPSMRRGRSDWTQLLESVGAAYVRGVDVAWDRIATGRKIGLPTYPFQRERYWLEAQADSSKVAPHEGVPFERIAAAAARAADAAPLDLSLHTYGAKWESLDRLTTAYVVEAFRTLGAFAYPGERRGAGEMVAALGILPLYDKVIARWLARLAAEGLLREDAGAFVSPQPLPVSGLEAIRATAAREFSDVPRLLEYVERAGRRLVPVLTGKEGSLETLFPDGSFAIAESLYETSPTPRYFNGIVRAVVEAAAAASTPDRRLRILEIGAGVGGTTAAVVPALMPDRVVYYFTDLSQLFLLRAEGRLTDYPFMRYGLLDIEQPGENQGMPAGSFDVVIATNVLHATRDLHVTLQHVRELLASGGLLVLNENTDHPGWFDLGLVEGWQRFEDDVRIDSPVLSANKWSDLLLAEGFAQVASFPRAESPAAVLGQHVITAGVAGAAVGAAGGRDWQSMLAAGAGQAGRSRAQEAEALVAALHDALPAERTDMLIGYVRDQVAAVLRLDGAPPDRRQRLMDLGLDSLMAVELRNRLASGLALARSLPATLMFDYPTIDAIAGYLERDALALVKDEGEQLADAATPGRDFSEAAARLEELTDEEAEALLLEKLGNL
jgi:malonyl CoA-acyl carrier protein transacylase